MWKTRSYIPELFTVGKRVEGDCACAGSCPLRTTAAPLRDIPVISVRVNGKPIRALIDTGCSKTIVSMHQVHGLRMNTGENVVAFDGSGKMCEGTCKLDVEVNGKQLCVLALISKQMIAGIDIILGMDIISEMGGVFVDRNSVHFQGEVAASGVNSEDVIEDKDFYARFDGESWIVRWKFIEDRLPVLHNKAASYSQQMSDEKHHAYELEVERWIAEGIMVPWTDQVHEGILPLLAVDQPNKNKVRPVLDYRELNNYIENHTGGDFIDVCSERLREWRKARGSLVVVDLKAAYLQIKIESDLWKYQLINYKGKTYCLTRLGFGLKSAPKIMSKVLKTVLGKSEVIAKATSSYIDDILVDTSMVSVDRLRDHLKRYGFVTKEPECLNGSSVLGLHVSSNSQGLLQFTRGNEVPTVGNRCSRRELFSICGKLTGHYPVAGWLRVACSFVKRMAEGNAWEDYIGDHSTLMINEIIQRVQLNDPVKGMWHADADGIVTVWCDASSLALGVLMEVNGGVVEDAAWLRKKHDSDHINVAELDAFLKGINLCVNWGYKNIRVVTDSVTVCNWAKVSLSEEGRIRTKGAAELLIKRRLGTLKSLVNEFGLKLEVELVASQKNKADALTRVPNNWLKMISEEVTENTCCVSSAELRELHDKHHFGVNRSYYIAKQLYPDVSKDDVGAVVRSCLRCQAIDPAPVAHCPGELGVSESWHRMAVDVTHFRHKLFFTMIDCGPGRFALWREIKHETAECVTSVLNEVFEERGPVRELLLDNATVFKSRLFEEMCSEWRVQRYFRAAYRPQGNGIIERHHRTIKSIAERANITPGKAVFFFFCTPRRHLEEDSVPYRSVYSYEWRNSMKSSDDGMESGAGVANVKVGDEVWVKPPNSRCTTQWERGVVTGLNSANNVSVNGTPRHVLDIRPVVLPVEIDCGNGDADVDVADVGDVVREVEAAAEPAQPLHRPVRVRHPPIWTKDYVM